MRLLKSENIRKKLNENLDIIKFELKNHKINTSQINIRAIEEIEQLVFERRKESKDLLNTNYGDLVSVVYTGIISISILGLAITSNCNNKPVSSNWINRDGTPEPNLIIQNMVVNIVNHSLAAVKLIELGLDNSAKVIIRTICEISWLTLVVSANKNIAIKYSSGIGNKAEINLWREELRFSKLKYQIEQIEKLLNFGESEIEYFKKYRDKLYSKYSQILHNSYSATMVGAYSQNSNSIDEMHLNLFGKFSISNEATLTDLRDVIFYFIELILPIFLKVHKYKLMPEDELWAQFAAYRKSFINLYFGLQGIDCSDLNY